MEAAGVFTEKLWSTIQPVYQQIISSRYIKRLTDGTLPHSWFAHYISQDVLYIIDDSRALAMTAARTENPDEMYFFLQLAKDGLDIERALHDEFLKHYTIPEASEKSPAFSAYENFLLHHAFYSPYTVAAAALLPCFWVYYKTGEYVLKNAAADNPYQKWIDTYSGTEYREYTSRFIQITEKLGQNATPEIREHMINAFTEGTEHELKVLEEAVEE